jgi:exopolyphosphatase/guanosine-5'-triphosphate,3'-diphosphate pyrophosphatase
VRLIETLPHSNPPTREELRAARQWVNQFLREQVSPQLDPILSEQKKRSLSDVNFVGTGGTATILARMESQLDGYDRTQIENTRISYERARWHAENLWSLPLEKRKTIVGLPSNRADVILGGVVIYEVVMETFDFSELRISTRGLRFAAVLT